MYRAEVYDSVKTANPTAKTTQIAKIIGEMWERADSDIKVRLENAYKQKKADYDA